MKEKILNRRKDAAAVPNRKGQKNHHSKGTAATTDNGFREY